MNKIYILSGLGVDKRVFDHIDFHTKNIEFIDWIQPLKNESLAHYAKRMAAIIKEDDATLIGLSFGGILSVEISKIKKLKKIILIASAKTKYELPLFYRLIGKISLNKLLPNSILKIQNFITNWIFGLESESDKKLLKAILKDTDPVFLSWAINEIVNWKNTEYPKNYIHIHGDKDRIIPIRNVKKDYVIPNGGHFMTVNKAKEIEKIIHYASM